jgi:hypothetical protein
MALVNSKQLRKPISGSFTGSFFGDGSGLTNLPGSNLFQIATGSVTASVSTNSTNLFSIQAGNTSYFSIDQNSKTTLSSNLFIIRNFSTQEPVLTVSQSVVQFATQSSNPTGTTNAGSIWFTSASMFVGLE